MEYLVCWSGDVFNGLVGLAAPAGLAGLCWAVLSSWRGRLAGWAGRGLGRQLAELAGLSGSAGLAGAGEGS